MRLLKSFSENMLETSLTQMENEDLFNCMISKSSRHILTKIG